MITLAEHQKTKQQRDALRRLLRRQVQEAAREIVLLEEQLHELRRAAREVVKWRGSPDTPWRSAVDNLALLLPDENAKEKV